MPHWGPEEAGVGIEDWFLTAAERGNPAYTLPDWSTGNAVVAHVHGAAYFSRLVAVVVRVVTAGVAQVDAPGERDDGTARVRRPGHDHLRVVRPGAAHPLVEQHLAARLAHVVAELSLIHI